MMKNAIIAIHFISSPRRIPHRLERGSSSSQLHFWVAAERFDEQGSEVSGLIE